MRIQVNGKQLDVGDALRKHAEDKVAEVANKYAQRPVEALITFSKDRHEFISDTSIHLSTGMTAQAKARAGDVYGALDGSVERIEKQLRRYKRRLKDHHKKREKPIEVVGADAYILESTVEEDDHDEPASLQPVIIAEMETSMPSLSVGEAVMQMELAGAPVLVFRNDSHGRVNVVYRRDDGHVGWVDPRQVN